MPFKTLPKAGNDLWEQAYAAGLKKFNGDKSRAATYAWGTIKKVYKKVGDKWVKKNSQEMAADFILQAFNVRNWL